MDNTSSSESKDRKTEPPAPQVLSTQVDDDSKASETDTPQASASVPKTNKRPRHVTYRPSHKATFIGLAVVVAILAINAAIIAFVVNGQSKADSQASQGQVVISQGVLNKLGVSRNSIGNTGIELTVNPDARFKGKVQVGGDTNISGQLKLNGKLSATDADLAELKAGNTSLEQLNVNGNGTLSTLNLRNDLIVAGITRLQGAVTLSQLLTVNNNVSVTGNLAVGGTLSAGSLHVSNFISDTNITVGGHIITRGSAPGVGPGSSLGSNGSVSISGNDASGTVAVNVGAGGGGGIVANVAFRAQYGTVPHVVVTAVGPGAGSVYVTRTIGGFSIGVNGALAPGGYTFDYIVAQ